VSNQPVFQERASDNHQQSQVTLSLVPGHHRDVVAVALVLQDHRSVERHSVAPRSGLATDQPAPSIFRLTVIQQITAALRYYVV